MRTSRAKRRRRKETHCANRRVANVAAQAMTPERYKAEVEAMLARGQELERNREAFAVLDRLIATEKAGNS